MKTILITGSCGLVGSEAVDYFSKLGWKTVGIDNNQRFNLFGPDGDTSLIRKQQSKTHTHFNWDIRESDSCKHIAIAHKPDAIFHCAAQPSHDKAAEDPVLDFTINANGTLNLLETCRKYCPESPFIFMSTNKVYGDSPNNQSFTETETRFIPERLIDETEPIDQSMHSLFGVSKTSADLLVQEYGRYFGMPTCCFRAGCITGKNHQGTEQHGFLAYLARCYKDERPYTIHGYKGKQVRDIVHAEDICKAALRFTTDPTPASVYNIGGGSCNTSIHEAIRMMLDLTNGNSFTTDYVEEPRKGDHQAYITNYGKIAYHLFWEPSWTMENILQELM